LEGHILGPVSEQVPEQVLALVPEQVPEQVLAPDSQ
jgi:hypothetical protein